MDVRRIVDDPTARAVMVQFVKQELTFKNHDDSTGKLMLNMLGAVAEFDRSLILERQREGIAIAKRAGKYRGRGPTLNAEQNCITECRGKRVYGYLKEEASA